MGGLRLLTAGESHGRELVAILEGIPAGLPLTSADVDADLSRRQKGYGRGGRMKIEHDSVSLRSGVRGGETLGSPIALVIPNRDWPNWEARMRPEPFETPPEPLVRARPGHVDLAGGLKYDRKDLRDVLERASARETAVRVAAGAVAAKLLAAVGIRTVGNVVSIGDVETDLSRFSWEERLRAATDGDLRCPDAGAEARMKKAIQAAAHDGDTLGGVFEVVARGVPPGLGSHVQADRKIDGRLAGAMMAIPAIKGVEIGLGFGAARRRGSEVHDAIAWNADGSGGGRFTRPTNRAGGTEGGITNGEDLVVRAAMKPISTLKKPLRSVDVRTKEALDAAHERSDVCAVAAASVVGEAAVRLVVADALLEKFGGDSLRELVRNVEGYLAQLGAY